jgi:hypothetical protein
MPISLGDGTIEPALGLLVRPPGALCQPLMVLPGVWWVAACEAIVTQPCDSPLIGNLRYVWGIEAPAVAPWFAGTGLAMRIWNGERPQTIRGT